MQNIAVNREVFAEPDALRLAHRLAAVAGQDLAPQASIADIAAATNLGFGALCLESISQPLASLDDVAW